MSIYGVILENTDADGRLRTYGLPDDTDTSTDVATPQRVDAAGSVASTSSLGDADSMSAPHFAPGAQDGIASYHMEDAPVDEATVANLIQGMSKVAKRVSPSLETTSGFKAQLERVAGDASLVKFFDPEFESLAAESFSIQNADAVLEAWAKTDPHRWETALLGALLATTSDKRPAVKLGIALVADAGANFWQEELTELGKHPEFTYWAVKALTETIGVPPRRTDALTKIFLATEGWGKVRVLEELTQSPDPEMRDWLLRSALDGDWLVGAYCALRIAESADLATALRATRIDDELFNGATHILGALVDKNPPNGDLSDYCDSLAAVESWIRHARRRSRRRAIHRRSGSVAQGDAAQDLLGRLCTLRDHEWSAALESRWRERNVQRVIEEAIDLRNRTEEAN